MKHNPVRRKRLSKYGKIVCILLFVAIIFFLVIPTSSTPTISSTQPPYECKETDVIQLTCDKNLGPVGEKRRLMGKTILPKYTPAGAKEYNPTDLSGTPAISGGVYTDQQYLDMPRDGEKFVPFTEYLDCLGARLGVDYKNKKELELTKEEAQKSFPYVVSLATVEIGDIKALMCNINVPIQHMMYVVNSDVSAINNFFHDVQKAFEFTTRLRVHWPGYNMGFGGAVNFGMRDALRYSFDEVPFFFILNNDIRFPAETLPASLPEFRRVTKQDKEVLEGLRKEVAAEPSKYTPKDRCHPLLRSSDNSTLLVTSTSLPDRIRYMPFNDRKSVFEKHFGGLFLDSGHETAAFGMSRLAIETVGFMDENFYPAYYEDTDWRYRQGQVGFSDFVVEGIPYKKHFENVIHRLASRYDTRPTHATEAEAFAKGAFHIIHSVFNEHTIIKKFGHNFRTARVDSGCTTLPIDAWVMDVPRRKVLIEAFTASHKFFKEGGPAKMESKNALLLGWLSHGERERLLAGFPGDPINQVVMRAFKDCKLVRHTD